MKKCFKSTVIVILILVFTQISHAQTLITGNVEMDWPLLSQESREQVLTDLRTMLFKDLTTKIETNELKEKFKNNWKDANKVDNLTAIKLKIKNIDDRTLAGFYFLNKLLIAYGVQYDKDLYHVYYYDVLGNLRYIDFSGTPNNKYPYIAHQYNTKGELIGVVYNISEYDQYIFKANGKFYGRWYYEKLYDKKAKIIMTRTIFE